MSLDFMELKKFIPDIAKTFAKYSLPHEDITIHAPENHGGHGLHSQFNFIDKSKGEKGDCTSQFRFPDLLGK